MSEHDSENTGSAVLIIDDEGGMRRVLCSVLEDEGFEVLAASDGVAGLMLMEASPADVVITDIIMPGKGGNEAIFTLRREFPEARIIAMSGGGRKGNMSFLQMAEKQGADRILEKPFDLDAMVEMVKELVAMGPRTASPDQG